MTKMLNIYLKLKSGDAQRTDVTGETTEGINRIAIFIWFFHRLT